MENYEIFTQKELSSAEGVKILPPRLMTCVRSWEPHGMKEQTLMTCTLTFTSTHVHSGTACAYTHKHTINTMIIIKIQRTLLGY